MPLPESTVARPPPVWRSGLAVLAGIGLIGLAVFVGWLGFRGIGPAITAADHQFRTSPGDQPAAARAATPAARIDTAASPTVPPASATASAASQPLHFDIVRVAPDGGAVIAGRAPPDAQVIVRDGKQEIGRTAADSSGQWVMVPETFLPPGGQELTLSMVNPDGTERQATGSVLLSVPERSSKAGTALAVLSGSGTATRVLQAPVARRPGAFGLDAVDYDEHGAIRFSGHAPAGSTVRVYVDNHPAGDAKAAPDGSWTLAPPEAVAPGRHQLRVDQLNGKGRVVARVELPFQQEKVDASLLASDRVIVQPGESLWRIARHAYGQGVHYTVIYAANRDQIRNPDLIYPGQTFTMPDPATIPASASRSR